MLGRRGFMGGPAAVALAGGARAAPAARTTIAAAQPINPAEREARLARIQALMRARGVTALLVEAGSALTYFTGIQWGRSERLTGALLPAEGEILVVTPGFEEPRVRELLDVPAEVRVWQEGEDPGKLVAGWLRERRLAGGLLAVEATVRFFVVDGVRKQLPDLRTTSGAALVDAVRMRKSVAEIALMQRATDITIAAYRDTYKRVVPDMSGPNIAKLMEGAMLTLGGANPSAGVQVGEGSAYPHGSKRPETVREGSLVLMDCTCTVDGYYSDVSRTFNNGAPSPQQRKVWEQARRGQEVAFAAARLGAPAGSVDDAVRRYYETLGYGPGYRTPGLPHRTGHGVGLDVHEPVNLVHGEATRLDVGMCFSNEPGIYLPGAFGVRIEDCFYMTPSGPRYFSTPPPSIDNPFG